MFILQLSMLTLTFISMGNLELPLLLEPVLNGFHFILLQYHCQKRIGRFPQHIKRGNIFCSPFLHKDDLDKFVHILFLAITAQHNTSYFNYLSNKLAGQLYHFNFSFFSLWLDVCSMHYISKISSTSASFRLINISHKLISPKWKKEDHNRKRLMVTVSQYSQAVLWMFQTLQPMPNC